jgi:hypothetical protein
MISLDYEALRRLPVAREPFAHIVVPRFLPAGDLAAVIAGLPRLSRGGSFPVGSLRLGAGAAELCAALEGERLRAEMAEKFGLDLRDAATMLTLRGYSREADGRIHCDSPAKRVTVLLYLNRAEAAWQRHEGCLRLLRGPHDIEDYAVEVPPVDGTLLAFLNGPTAWHGHARHVGPRYVMQLNYMADDAKARSELRRHRFSALLKRMAGAAYARRMASRAAAAPPSMAPV